MRLLKYILDPSNDKLMAKNYGNPSILETKSGLSEMIHVQFSQFNNQGERLMKNLILIATLSTLAMACSHKDKHADHTAAPAAVPAPTITRAQAVLKGAAGTKVKGVVHFTQEGDQVRVEVMAEGVKPGPHGFHIHETGDCSAKDFSSAGGHFNPTGHQHADLKAPQRHAGDFGNVIADKKWMVKTTIEDNMISLNAGPTDIIGKAVVLHADKDDLKSQPAGNSGKRIACGVIEAL